MKKKVFIPLAEVFVLLVIVSFVFNVFWLTISTDTHLEIEKNIFIIYVIYPIIVLIGINIISITYSHYKKINTITIIGFDALMFFLLKWDKMLSLKYIENIFENLINKVLKSNIL